jgi:hypothetical protein
MTMNEKQILRLRTRVYDYAEKVFQDSGKTKFPTVREVASALNKPQIAIKAAIEEDQYGNLMLTSLFCSPPDPLGDHFVETFEQVPVNTFTPFIARAGLRARQNGRKDDQHEKDTCND